MEKTQLDDVTLLSLVRMFLNEHSGGIKFVELVTDIVSHLGETLKKEDFATIDFSELDYHIEKVISETSDIRILNYTWHSCNKQKMFVYTP